MTNTNSHGERVESMLKAFGVTDPELLTAGLLHEALVEANDPVVTLYTLITHHGERVASLIDAVTPVSGASKVDLYTKINRVPGAKTVFLADQLVHLTQARIEGDPHTVVKFRLDYGDLTVYICKNIKDKPTELLAEALTKLVPFGYRVVHAAKEIDTASNKWSKMVRTVCGGGKTPKPLYEGRFTTDPCMVTCSMCLSKKNKKDFEAWRERASLIALGAMDT